MILFMQTIDSPSLVMTLVLILTPVLGVLASMANLFNLGKKELEDFFEKVREHIQGRKVENLSRIVFPKKIGADKTNGDISVSDDALKLLCSEMDRVNDLDRELQSCSNYCSLYYRSLLLIILTGFLFAGLRFSGFEFNTILQNYLVLSWIVVIYVLGGFVVLSIKKENLNHLYGKEYTI